MNEAHKIGKRETGIEVKTFDGKYYCSVADIAFFKTSKGISVTPFEEIINLYEKGILRIRVANTASLEYMETIKTYNDIITGGSPINEATLFTSETGDFTDSVLLSDGIYKVVKLSGATKSNRSIAVTAAKKSIGDLSGFFVEAIYSKNSIKPSLLMTCVNGKLEIRKMGVADYSLFYASLQDTSIYLADIMCDDDFISDEDLQFEKKSEVINVEMMPLGKQKETEIITHSQPAYLDENHESYPPFLAIAVDIWERLFIHNEGNPKRTATERAKGLIKRHYPNADKDKNIDSIAYIVTSFIGDEEKSQKNKNNG